MDQPGCVTISHTTACIWSTVGRTAMVNMVAVDCLVQLNSLMHVARAGLLSQHGWDGGIHACLQHSCMQTHTNCDQLTANTHMCVANKHAQTNTCTPRCLWLWAQQYDVTKRAMLMSTVRVWPQDVMWIHICLNSHSPDTWLRREYVVMVLVFRNVWANKSFTCTGMQTYFCWMCVLLTSVIISAFPSCAPRVNCKSCP